LHVSPKEIEGASSRPTMSPMVNFANRLCFIFVFP
jgi:hypothetical protein